MATSGPTLNFQRELAETRAKRAAARGAAMGRLLDFASPREERRLGKAAKRAAEREEARRVAQTRQANLAGSAPQYRGAATQKAESGYLQLYADVRDVSARAHHSGSAEDHAKASKLHREAATEAIRAGFSPAQHDRLAKEHNKHARKARAQQPAAKAPEAPKAAQTGKRGGKFVMTESGKKRYLGKSGK